ncbi:hypothetical protein MKW92_019701 [Papaver armeniacum]|nr:hypothetical protein MKW92_019701 [Papaver armeniacum]
MGRCGEDVTEIDIKPDGSWRAKNDKEHLELTQWHFPNGSLCIEIGKNIKPDLENSAAEANKDKPIRSHGMLSYKIFMMFVIHINCIPLGQRNEMNL